MGTGTLVVASSLEKFPSLLALCTFLRLIVGFYGLVYTKYCGSGGNTVMRRLHKYDTLVGRSWVVSGKRKL